MEDLWDDSSQFSLGGMIVFSLGDVIVFRGSK